MPQLESMTQHCSPACQPEMRRNQTRKSLGTTLIEILVVIVVFLVGILAVIQIFPKGFQLLLLNRSKTVAQALARDEVESLKARPDELPEQIVSAYYLNGNLIIDSSKDPNDLSPWSAGDPASTASLNSNGYITDGLGNGLGNWTYLAGANAFRRVIGEGRRVPAPRLVGTNNAYYGGLMVLRFGPINYVPANGSTPSNVSVYGNDLEQISGFPPATVQYSDYQYFVGSSATTGATAVELPSGSSADADRLYRISFSAYVSNGSGGVIKRDYSEITPYDVPGTALNATGQYPLTNPVALYGLGGLVTDPIVSIDLNTLRIQRLFLPLAKGSAFSSRDPYQYQLLNENLGVLLFNPIGNGVYVSRIGHDREPLTARVNYDVFDWRILHDEFRVDVGILPGEVSSSDPQVLIGQHKLPVGSLKVLNNAGVDGLPNTPIPNIETSPNVAGTTNTSAANGAGTENFVLLDLDTGGVYCEVNTSNTSQQLITVNKSTGVVTINDLDGDATNGITGELLLPDGTTTNVQMDNRAVRALYMVNQEYSVQVLKAAAQYTIAASPVNLSPGQFYIGGTVSGVGLPYRIYFPQGDNGRKVTVGQVTYLRSTDAYSHELIGQDFLITTGADPTLSLPFIDLTRVDSVATQVNFQNGIGARGVKGASVAVRVLWNPASFHLTGSSPSNITALTNWQQSYRKSINETFLQQEDNNR